MFFGGACKDFSEFGLTRRLFCRNHFALPHIKFEPGIFWVAGCASHAEHQVIFDR
jgi:hypothetical protein